MLKFPKDPRKDTGSQLGETSPFCFAERKIRFPPPSQNRILALRSTLRALPGSHFSPPQ